MDIARSILRGSAAGFIAVTGAAAADLPMTKAAPVEHVKACTLTGKTAGVDDDWLTRVRIGRTV